MSQTRISITVDSPEGADDVARYIKNLLPNGIVFATIATHNRTAQRPSRMNMDERIIGLLERSEDAVSAGVIANKTRSKLTDVVSKLLELERNGAVKKELGKIYRGTRVEKWSIK